MGNEVLLWSANYENLENRTKHNSLKLSGISEGFEEMKAGKVLSQLLSMRTDEVSNLNYAISSLYKVSRCIKVSRKWMN